MCGSYQCSSPPFACKINLESDDNKKNVTTNTTCKGLNGTISEWKETTKSTVPKSSFKMMTAADINGKSNNENQQSG